MKKLQVNFEERQGKIKPLHGVNSGPLTALFCYDASEYFRAAHIPFSRLHNIEGAFGDDNFVDIPCVFKNYDADPEDPASYSFAHTDAYMKAINDCETRVVYRLGVTIENRAPQGTFIPVLPPKDYVKWARICEGIIRHYNEGWAHGFHYNIQYWEIWNEPEREAMWAGTWQQYYELYSAVSRHLKKCFPNIKIGGYGSTGFYPLTRSKESLFQQEPYPSLISYLRNFLQYVIAANAPLDFFSWHLYSNDPKEYAIHAHAAKNLFAEYGFQKIEFLLDEWNMSGDRSLEQMRSLEGAGMAAGVLCTLQNAPVDAAMYYSAEPKASCCGLFAVDLSAARAHVKAYKAYYSMKAFGVLYQLGTAVSVRVDDGLYACSAANGENGAILFTNYGSDPCELQIDVSGFYGENGVEVITYVIDEQNNLEPLKKELMTDQHFSLYQTLGENNVVLVELTRQ